VAAQSVTIAGARPGATRWSRIRRNRQALLFCYLALAPVLVLFFYVRVVPIIESVALSFYRWDLIKPLKPFIGLRNYTDLLSDENFRLALENTLIYSVATVVVSTLLALPLAVFLARKGWVAAVYQTIYFLPVITPLVPMAIAWRWIYDYNYGLFNYVLSFFGIPAVPWLTSPDIALWAIIIMSIWKGLGYSLILFLVGIRNIPESYLEAASLDGASPWQRFWHVTLPLLRPYLLVALLLRAIFEFRAFDNVYVMTGGGPANATLLLSVYTYQASFVQFDLSLGAAASWVMLLIALVACLAFVALIGRKGTR